jgi:hypothetical protein
VGVGAGARLVRPTAAAGAMWKIKVARMSASMVLAAAVEGAWMVGLARLPIPLQGQPR